MPSCQRCGETHTRPDAFLLTCRACRKDWHHRCLMPPMEDVDLIRLIRATNAGDMASDLSSWICRRCKKRASETSSATSSREQTVASESHEGSKNLASTRSSTVRDSTSAANAPATEGVRVKQESSATVDVRLVSDRERDKKGDRQQLTEAAPAKPTLVSKRTKPPAVNQHHVLPPPAGPMQARDTDVQMADAAPPEPTLQEKKSPPHRPSPPTRAHPGKAARKLDGTVSESTTSPEGDVEIEVDSLAFSKPNSRATSRVSQAHYSVRPETVVEAPSPMRAASVGDEQVPEMRPADRAAIQPRVNQVASEEVDDDPEDLYGPPVERRIIRILPSLAEEMREQQRRVAAEKERRRAPLAPDWILARHVNDPQWKEIPATEGRNRRKPTARKLGNNGLDVNELMGYFTVENWVREHKS